MLLIISVVKDHLVSMTEIPSKDDFAQKSFCVEDYIANVTSDLQILHAQRHSPGVQDHSRVHIYLVVGLCKL